MNIRWPTTQLHGHPRIPMPYRPLGASISSDSHSSPESSPTQTTNINFYSNSNVLRYAELPLVPFSLRQLIFFGKILNRLGSDRDDLNHSLLQGANFTRVQLPIRLARQIREFQSLPYIVTSNRYLTETYKIYVEAFEKIRTYPEIRCGNDNRNWCKFLQGLLNQHKVVIPKLAIGVAESASHLTNSQVEQFMTRMLHSRISRRVLAEHHIALTRQFQDYNPENAMRYGDSKQSMRYLGVIDTELEVGKVVDNCIQLAKTTLISSSNHNSSTPSPFSPLSLRVLVRGEKNAKFAYIPDHLEFVVFELLLNAFRATIERATKQKQQLNEMPIEVQIAASSTHITIRISDQAGGINYSMQSRSFNSEEEEEESFPFSVSRREMFSFVNLLKTNRSHSNHNLIHLISSKVGMEGKIQEQIPSHVLPPSSIPPPPSNRSEEIQEARLRIGLPLSSIYAQFFGGSLEMNSIPGYSDIVLCIPKLGTTTESP